MSDLLDRFRVDWSQDKPPEPPRLTPTFYDLEEGDCAKHPYSATLYWWTDGNGSCDCNRVAGFPEIEGDEEEEDTCTCVGCHRYIAINFEADGGPIDIATKDALCAALNEGYAEAIHAWAKGCEVCERTPQHMEHFPCKRRNGG